ncbi:MAG: phage portal protein, partial [Pseudobdellovibrionaceae bacterium]|nr:phage portal protein [Pseudobdellovibrionaceae bacterium]
GLMLTYENLTGDLSDVNYSSMRAGWVEFHRNVMTWQDMIIQQMCKPTFQIFAQYAGIRGLYTKPIRAQWIPPRREMLDVVKETDAIIKLMAAGLLPFTDALIEMGKDPEKVINQLQKDVEKLDKLNLNFSWTQDQNPVGAGGNEATGSEDFSLN